MVPLSFAGSAAVWAGCTSQDERLAEIEVDSDAERDEAAWPDPILHDGNRAPLADPALAEDTGRMPAYPRQPLPRGGAEPNVGVTSEENPFVSTYDRTQRSTDEGRTWEMADAFETPAQPVTEDVSPRADPRPWVDPDTDRIFTAPVHPARMPTSPWPMGTYLSWRNDGGESCIGARGPSDTMGSLAPSTVAETRIETGGTPALAPTEGRK